MSQLIIAAFMMGLLGSFHCVGMCGPIALSLPLKHDSHWAKFFGALFYNSGRIITYSVFGFIFGIIGKSVALFGYQQWLSIILGVLIIFFIILPKRFSSFQNQNFILAFLQKLRSALGKEKFLFIIFNWIIKRITSMRPGVYGCGSSSINR